MKKVIFLAILVAFAYSVSLKSKSRYRNRKFSSRLRTGTKDPELSWFFVYKETGGNRFLKANAYIETLGIIAEPTGEEEEELDTPLSFGNGAIRMHVLQKTVDDSLNLYTKSATVRMNKVLKESSQKYSDLKKRIEKFYDDPTTRPVDGKEIPYHRNSLLMPYRFINKCNIKVEASNFKFPVAEFNEEERLLLDKNHPNWKTEYKNEDQAPGDVVNPANNRISGGKEQDKTVMVDNQYAFELIDPNDINNVKCSYPKDKAYPFTKVLLFPNPSTNRVVDTGAHSTEGLVNDCKEQVDEYKESMQDYATAMAELRDNYKYQLALFNRKKYLHPLIKKWRNTGKQLLQFFTSDGLGVPKIEGAIKDINGYLDLASSYATMDPMAYVAKYDKVLDPHPEIIQELTAIGDPFKDFHCINPDNKDCEYKQFTNRDVELQMWTDLGDEKEIERVKNLSE